MAKLIIIGMLLWASLFIIRVIQIGGIDPTYRDSEVELFLPLRQQFTSTINNILPFPQSTLLSGILLGDKKQLPFYLQKDLKTTSTIHMVVVSGQNLTILAGFLMSFVYLIGRRKTIIVSLLAIIFYSLLTGFGVPVVRAAIMTSLAFLAQAFGKEKAGAWTLFLTAGTMLLYNPNWLLGISFQLSFLATAGVMIVAPVLLNYFPKIPQIIKQDLVITLSAQLMVLPVLAYNFNQVSLVGILANSFVLWTIPIVMVTGFASLVLGLANTFLGQVVGLVPGVLLTYFVYIVEAFAKIPGANFTVGESSLTLWVGYYLILGAGVWFLKTLSTKY